MRWDEGRRGRRGRDERGLAAPLVVVVFGALLVLTLVGTALGRVLVDQRRAAGAADLAALAGAGAVQWGRPACAAARRIAAENGAALVRCTEDGPEVRLEVSVESPTLLDRTVSVRAQARAGPVTGEAVP